MLRRALLCGINDYKLSSVADLKGCVADVENFGRLLVEQFGFAEGDVHAMTDREVTKKAVKDRWKWLLGGARAGDHLVFHFSGHGSYLPDEDGDEDDGSDGLLCLWNMEFGNPGTYLLDDEVAKLTDDLPAGVLLTIVTDCCHSGTSTRVTLTRPDGSKTYEAVVDVNAGRARATGRNLESPEAVVQVRFLPPPVELVAPARAARPVRLRAAPVRATLNHVHLAACQDEETAADAYLDGGYNGAFTHALCAALRAERSLDQKGLESKVRSLLRNGQFNQRPKFNGGPRSAPLFGGYGEGGGGGEGEKESEPPEPTTVDAAAPGGDGAAGDALAHAHAKLAEAQAALAEAHRAIVLGRAGAAAPGLAGVFVGAARQADPVFVAVHGIGTHPEGYSGGWWDALRPHVDGMFGDGALGRGRYEVVWTRIVNEVRARDLADPAEVQRAKEEIEAQVAERQARYAEPGRAAEAQRTLSPLTRPGVRGGNMSLDDFTKYMFSGEVRGRVLDCFEQVARDVGGRPVHLVSHSWGTVVAYEALLEREAARGLDVRTFFTVGAALSIGVVRWKLGLKNVRPPGVRRWYNLDAKGDGVGGGIGRQFPLDGESLELEPTGCEKGWFGYDLACAHGSYFRAANVAVNRDIFARQMKWNG